MCVLISNFSDVTFGKRLLERKIQHLNCVYVHSLLLQCLFCVELLTIIVFTCSGGKNLSKCSYVPFPLPGTSSTPVVINNSRIVPDIEVCTSYILRKTQTD